MTTAMTINPIINTPEAILRCIKPHHPLDRERLYILTQEENQRLIHKHLLAVGTITVETARDIFRYLLYDGAADFTLVRYRPEPSPRPTDQERGLLEDLQTVCEILQLELQDCLLVGSKDCYSFADENALHGSEIPF